MKIRKGSFNASIATSSGFRTARTQSAITIGDATITFPKSIQEDVPASFSVTFTGNAKDVQYAWETSPASSIEASTASSTNITFASSGSYTITCTLTSVSAGETVVESVVRSVTATPSEPLNVGSSFVPATGTWETYTDFATAISGASAGSTVDLGGRGFCITGDWTNDKDDKAYEFTGDGFTIKDAYFRGAKQIESGSWTQCNDGVTYYAPLPYTRDPAADLADDFRCYLLDDSVSTPPRYSLTIPNRYSSELGLDNYRFMAHSDMILVQGDTESFLVVNASENNRVQRLVLVETAHVDYVNSHLADMDDVTDAQMLVLSGPNVAGVDRVVSWGSWTDVDGEAGEAGLTYDNVLTVSMDGPTSNQGYYAFTLVNVEIRDDPAQVSLANPGEYIVDNQNSRVYYRPTAGLSKVFFPVASSVIKTASVSAGTDFVFEECTFEGNQFSRSGNKPYLLEVELFADKAKTEVRSCHFKNGIDSTQVMTIDRCLFERAVDAHVLIGSGVQVTNSKFLTCEGRTCLSLRYADEATYTELPRTNIINCFFENKSAHGQGVSLYQGSWMNATVKHCIFYNCFRALSFQRRPRATTPPPSGARFLFENNLLYWDVEAEVDLFKGAGQAYVAFNDGDWEYSELEGVVKWRYNTYAAAIPSDGVALGVQPNQRYLSTDLANLISADTEIVGNIASGFRTPAIADSGAGIVNNGHRHWDNIFLLAPGGSGAGQYSTSIHDYGDNGASYDLSDVFSMSTCQPTVSTGNASLTPPGVRWTSYPNLTGGDIGSSIDIDWYLTYSEAAIPSTPADPTDPTDLGNLFVHKRDDKRA